MNIEKTSGVLSIWAVRPGENPCEIVFKSPFPQRPQPPSSLTSHMQSLMKKIGHYSVGIGDRFALEGAAQLKAFAEAKGLGVSITPVWNKSNREHTIIGTHPDSVRTEADAAVKKLGWQGDYFVDADHIGLATVDRFLAASDFFTMDVADFIGKPAREDALKQWVRSAQPLLGILSLPWDQEVKITGDLIEKTGQKYLLAVGEAGKVYRHIADKKGAGNFVPEVSMDETDQPQTPGEMLLILHMIAQEGIPIQTVAPKFSGRFNKGVDYVGDVALFEKEFFADVSVVAYAVENFGLPANLKLSVHSGSDKFSIYPAIRRVLAQTQSGVHVKTAGTTWLEEVIGLAEAGGSGLAIAKKIYSEAYAHSAELAAPYATVLDLDLNQLPSPATVNEWDSATFVATLRHDQKNPSLNLHFRQLLHVGFKIAAKMGSEYTDALQEHRAVIEKNVFENLFERHLKPLFL